MFIIYVGIDSPLAVKVERTQEGKPLLVDKGLTYGVDRFSAPTPPPRPPSPLLPPPPPPPLDTDTSCCGLVNPDCADADVTLTSPHVLL